MTGGSGVGGSHRPFRFFFWGRTVGTFGDNVSPVALAFAVLSVSRSPAALGIVLAAQLAPEALLVLFGGVVADRTDRRLVMLAADVARLLLQGASAGLLLAHAATLGELIVLQAGYGAATAFFGPASLGYLSQLVPADRLQRANSLSGLTKSVSTIAGPALGGLLVAAGSPGAALAVDAATFAVSAALLGCVRGVPSAPASQTESVLRSLASGWREFIRRRWVWVLVLLWAVYQAGVLSAYEVLGPVVSQRHLGGAGAWAAVLTARGIGAAAAGLIGLRYRPRHPMRVNVILLLADVPLLVLLSLPAAIAAIVVVSALEGAALSYGGILWYSSLQERIPERAQSRVFAFDQLGSIAAHPAGLLVLGFAAARLGTRTALLGVGGLLLASAAASLSVGDVRLMGDRPALGDDRPGSVHAPLEANQ